MIIKVKEGGMKKLILLLVVVWFFTPTIYSMENLGIGVTNPLTKRLEVGSGGLQLHDGGIPANTWDEKSTIIDHGSPSIGGEGARFWSIGTGTTHGRFNFYIMDGTNTPVYPNEIGCLFMTGPAPGFVGIGHGATNPVSQLQIVQASDHPEAGISLGGLTGPNNRWQIFLDGNDDWNFRWAATGQTPLKIKQDGTVVFADGHVCNCN